MSLALYQQWAQQHPTAIALISEKECYDWATVYRLSKHYAASIAAQGLRNGDVLTIVSKNQPELIFIYLACLHLGVIPAICMPQPYSLLLAKLSILYKKTDSPFLWIGSSASDNYTEKEIQLLKEKTTLINIKPLGSMAETIKTSNNISLQPHPLGLSSIIFTSGSSGNPKAVAHSSKQHIASAEGLLSVFDYNKSDCWLLSLPMFHVSGLAILWRWLVAGSCIKIGNGNRQEDIQGVSHASLVVTQLKRLLDDNLNLTLKRVLLGGSQIPQSLILKAKTRGVDVWYGYGLTEAASTVTVKQCTLDANTSTGTVLPKRELKIMNQRIYLRGETISAGYYHQGKLSPLLENNWFDTNDLGQWINDELVILGRADNQFISGGENIHCEEIEAVLNQHPNIRQAFIIPVKDNEYGARPVAILDCDKLVDGANYQTFLQGRIEKYKFPIRYLKMPALASQGIKVSRKTLSDWFTKL